MDEIKKLESEIQLGIQSLYASSKIRNYKEFRLTLDSVLESDEESDVCAPILGNGTDESFLSLKSNYRKLQELKNSLGLDDQYQSYLNYTRTRQPNDQELNPQQFLIRLND